MTTTFAAPEPARPPARLPFEPLLGIDELAELLGVPVQTIYKWRSLGYGPPAIKIGKHLKWRPRSCVNGSNGTRSC